MGKFLSKKEDKDTTTVADAVKQGVTEGVKQAKVEEDAATLNEIDPAYIEMLSALGGSLGVIGGAAGLAKALCRDLGKHQQGQRLAPRGGARQPARGFYHDGGQSERFKR